MVKHQFNFKGLFKEIEGSGWKKEENPIWKEIGRKLNALPGK
jgi:hypothetical protein